MTRQDVNNVVLAVAIGLVTAGAIGMRGCELPDLPSWPVTPDEPDEPDTPPTPDDPPGPLAALVTLEQRPLLVQFFTDMAAMVESDTAGVLDSTDKIREAQQAASRLLVQAGRLPANALLRAELERRQLQAFGDQSKPVDAVLRAEVAQFYRQIAEDF